MRKVLIIILIVITTIALTYFLIQKIGMKGFAFAWALNFLLMAGVLTFTETLKSPLTAAYFDAKPWENGGKIYQSFGINIFRKVLVWIGWERLNKKSNPVEKNTEALMQLHYKTKQSEIGHLIILIIVTAFTVFVATEYGFKNSLWLILLNVLFNLYPILLQRFNRPRIGRALNIAKQR
ncbi:MAG: hypothetical protein WKF66_14730 [Pedobacter sp.]